MEFEGENLTYKVKTSEEQMFLSIIPVKIKNDVVFDAQTGKVISVHRSLAARILDRLSSIKYIYN